MSISALQTWANEHAAWRLKMALERKACLACEMEEYMSDPKIDLSDALPCADTHEGPFCKKRRK